MWEQRTGVREDGVFILYISYWAIEVAGEEVSGEHVDEAFENMGLKVN